MDGLRTKTNPEKRGPGKKKLSERRKGLFILREKTLNPGKEKRHGCVTELPIVIGVPHPLR